jgi:hypothetical protein
MLQNFKNSNVPLLLLRLMFAGDFWQTLPAIIKGIRADVI